MLSRVTSYMREVSVLLSHADRPGTTSAKDRRGRSSGGRLSSALSKGTRKPMPPAVVEFGMLEWYAMYLCCEERARMSMSMADPWFS